MTNELTNEQIDLIAQGDVDEDGFIGIYEDTFKRLCEQAKRANLGVVAEPVAWAVVNLDGEIDALEIKRPEVIVGYARPLTWASPTP